jgi:hypothetical protein
VLYHRGLPRTPCGIAHATPPAIHIVAGQPVWKPCRGGSALRADLARIGVPPHCASYLMLMMKADCLFGLVEYQRLRRRVAGADGDAIFTRA